MTKDLVVTATFESLSSVRPGFVHGPTVHWAASRYNSGIAVTGPSGSSADVVVYDVRGKAVHKFTVRGGSLATPGVRLQSGNYFVVIRDRATGREVHSSRVLVAN